MNQTEKDSAVKSAKMGIIADALAALTLLSMFPYELGKLSIIVPPELKPWIAGIGLGSTLILHFWKRFQEIRTTVVANNEPAATVGNAARVPSGTASDPVSTIVINPANDPIPTSETKKP